MSPEQKQPAQTTVKHVGIIPDGNRRWARQNNIDLEAAYWLAMRKITDCADALFKAGVQSLSVYLLSKDNILRGRDDLEAVVIAETRMLRELVPALERDLGVRVYHAGNPASLDADFRAALEEVCEPGNGKDDPFPRLYLLAGYDAYEEVTNARAAIGPDPEQLLDSLSVPVSLDLVIRSAGAISASAVSCRCSASTPNFSSSPISSRISPPRVRWRSWTSSRTAAAALENNLYVPFSLTTDGHE